MSTTTARKVLLSVEAVSKVYRMGEVEVHALRDATLEIYEGELLVIVGPSGSGKSTLLNLIGGIDRPTSGTVRFLDQDLSRATDKELTLYRRHKVGFVFQLFNLIPTLTALENVQVAVEIVANPIAPETALTFVDLADRADHFPSQLSGGEQQRVAIARAVASNPRLLLSDEPTGALDMSTSRKILALLDRLRRELNMTIILITHNMAISRIADRVALMRDGRIAAVTTNERPVPPSEVSW